MNLPAFIPVVQGEKIKYSSQEARNGSMTWLSANMAGRIRNQEITVNSGGPQYPCHPPL